jgi:signal transduction histidine kinase
VLIHDLDPTRARRFASQLEATSLETTCCSTAAEAIARLNRDRPDLLILGNISLAEHADLAALARSLQVGTLGVVELEGRDNAPFERLRSLDQWVSAEAASAELAIRVLDWFDREAARKAKPLDARFLAIVVHDLRGPLNVLRLTIRVIEQTTPDRSPELNDDLQTIEANVIQVEKMLATLADYCRLLEASGAAAGLPFDPRRFVEDLVQARRSRPDADGRPIRIDAAESCPREVTLDQNRVAIALQHALNNASIAAGEAPVRVRLSGKEGRWVVEVIVDKPPPFNVEPVPIHPHHFERLNGSPGERRGLDLAIASWITEGVGGQTRLEVTPGVRSSIVIEWPERLGDAASA